jgi:hypothetical protein
MNRKQENILPNATKVFAWHACNNILPTKDNLKRRKVVQEDICMFCLKEAETVGHILWECPSASNVWGLCGRGIQKLQGNMGSFMEVVETIMARCSREELEKVLILAKKIWARRNEVVHGGEFKHPNQILRETEELIVSLQEITEKCDGNEIPSRSGEQQRWECPPDGWCKLNWDVAIDAHTNSMVFGAIIRNHIGRVCAAKCKRIQKVQEPVMGEAMAAMAAAEFCNSSGVQDVILEGDSLQVIQALQEANSSWRKYGHFIDGIKALLGPSRRWRFHHVKRMANKAADGLAKEGLQKIEEQTWIDESPKCITTIVSSELLARHV